MHRYKAYGIEQNPEKAQNWDFEDLKLGFCKQNPCFYKIFLHKKCKMNFIRKIARMKRAILTNTIHFLMNHQKVKNSIKGSN